MARTSKLPVHPKDLVLTALRKSDAPLTAYSLLDMLAPFGVKSAPIVYRALEALEQEGHVHKIKELGAYVACSCDEHHSHDFSIITVCDSCKKVHELHDHAVNDHLAELRRLGVNIPGKALIMLPVVCASCTAR